MLPSPWVARPDLEPRPESLNVAFVNVFNDQVC